MKRIQLTFTACSALLVSVCLAETEGETPAPQISDGVELPAWQPEYAVGHFDTRLWPDEVLEKVEIDHLRFLVSAPDVDPEDKEIYIEVVQDWERSHTPEGKALSYNMPLPN